MPAEVVLPELPEGFYTVVDGRKKANVEVVGRDISLREIADYILKQKKIYLDGESNYLEWWNFSWKDVAGFSISTVENRNFFFPVNMNRYYPSQVNLDPTKCGLFLSLILRKGIKVIYGNAKADWHILYSLCNDLFLGDFRDILINSHLVNVNDRHGVKTLGNDLVLGADFAERMLGMLKRAFGMNDKDHTKFDYRIPPLEVISIYGCADTWLTRLIDENLDRNPHLVQFLDYSKIEHEVARTLFVTENTGIKIDQDYTAQKLEEFTDLVAEDHAMIIKESGAWVNPESTPQMVQLLYDYLKLPVQYTERTKAGQKHFTRSADKLALMQLQKIHPVIPHIQKYRKDKKILEYLQKISTNLDASGRLHTNFNQFKENTASLRTGRLSSSEPINFENIPNSNDSDKVVRKCFVPDDYFFFADFQNQEGRLYAYYANEVKLKHAFITGEDVHGLTLDSKILTSKGWKLNRNLSLQDAITGVDGKFYPIIDIIPKGFQKVFKITFKDNTTVYCDNEHLWEVEISNWNRKYNVTPPTRLMNIGQLIGEGLKSTLGQYRFYVPVPEAIGFDPIQFKVDPWVLGFLIGDGGFTQTALTFTTADQEILDELKKTIPDGCKVVKAGKYTTQHFRIMHPRYRNPVIQELKRVGLWNCYSEEKFIPDEYKVSSIEQRLALLQGLCDADGSPIKYGCRISSTSTHLLDDVIDIVRSLGGITSGYDIDNPNLEGGFRSENNHSCYEIYFTLPENLNPFKLTRKATLVGTASKRRMRYRKAIKNIDYIGLLETQCINVSSPRNLFITDGYNLTHNSRTASYAFPEYSYEQFLALKGTDKTVKAYRDIGKRSFFRKLYGGGYKKGAAVLAEYGFEYDVERQKEIDANILRGLPRFRPWTQRVQDVCRERGYIFDIFGRHYLPKSQDRLYAMPNYLIQGTAGGMLKIAIVRITEEFGRELFSNFVHDEIGFDRLPTRNVSLRIRELMQDWPQINIPMIVECSWATSNWGEKDEIKNLNAWIEGEEVQKVAITV